MTTIFYLVPVVAEEEEEINRSIVSIGYEMFRKICGFTKSLSGLVEFIAKVSTTEMIKKGRQ